MWFVKIILGLTLVVTSTEGYCCSRNENNSSCCGAKKCNIFCCNCDHGGCRGGCFLNPASIKAISTEPSPAGAANARNRISSRQKRVAVLRLMPTYTLNRNQIQANRHMHATLAVYNTIDINQDSLINYDEALSYFRNVTGKIRIGDSASNTVKSSDYEFSLGFNEMDTNHDGVLEPHEFDNSLPV